MHVNKILYVWSKSFHIKFLFPYICFIFITYVTLQFNPHFIFYIPIYRVITNNCRGHTQYTPDATPCDFFLWGYVKDQVYVPPFPAVILELKVVIRTAIETITAYMRNELDYRVDVCRIPNDAHIEHL